MPKLSPMVVPTVLSTIMALLEGLLGTSKIRYDLRATAIAFELIDVGTFSFVPKHQGRLFVVGAAPDAALRLRCPADLFLRVLTSPDFRLRDDEPFEVSGHLDALTPLISALGERHDPLAIRALC